jgi:hypothetical protein
MYYLPNVFQKMGKNCENLLCNPRMFQTLLSSESVRRFQLEQLLDAADGIRRDLLELGLKKKEQ